MMDYGAQANFQVCGSCFSTVHDRSVASEGKKTNPDNSVAGIIAKETIYYTLNSSSEQQLSNHILANVTRHGRPDMLSPHGVVVCMGLW